MEDEPIAIDRVREILVVAVNTMSSSVRPMMDPALKIGERDCTFTGAVRTDIGWRWGCCSVLRMP